MFIKCLVTEKGGRGSHLNGEGKEDAVPDEPVSANLHRVVFLLKSVGSVVM